MSETNSTCGGLSILTFIVDYSFGFDILVLIFKFKDNFNSFFEPTFLSFT
jgi:hypothetical protein